MGKLEEDYDKRIDSLETKVTNGEQDYMALKIRFTAYMNLVKKSNPTVKRKACELSESENPVWMAKIKKRCPSKSFSRFTRVTTDEPNEDDTQTVNYPLPLSMFKDYPGDLFTSF